MSIGQSSVRYRDVCLAIAVAMQTTPTAAMEVLLGLPPVHVMIEAEAKAGIYRVMCNQQWKPKSTNFGHTKKSRDMEQKPILQIGSDRMLPRYACHKPFTVKFPDKCELQNGFKPRQLRGPGLVHRWVQDQYRHWCWVV
jgi:hypothetical protein